MEKRTAGVEIKQKNRTSIFQLLRRHEGLSRQDIVTMLRLSLPTVTQNLVELMEEGIVEECGSIGNTGGRRAKRYAINCQARVAIGLDITKNHISVAVVDMKGNVIAHQRVRFPFARTDEYAKKLADMVEWGVAETQIDRKSILGVGIGVPGLVSADHDRVIYGETLNFSGAEVDEFSKYIPYPTALYHDVHAACFAETWNNKDIKNAFYIMINNSLGGAIYVNHHLYSGDTTRSGEIGHITLVPNGRRCYCGKLGCVDTYCSTGNLASLADGNLGAFFDLLEAGDPQAKYVWTEYIGYLATAINMIRMLFDCDVILGGYIGEYIDTYIDDLRKLIAEKNPFDDNSDYLLPCKCKTAAVATGAALGYISSFLETI